VRGSRDVGDLLVAFAVRQVPITVIVDAAAAPNVESGQEAKRRAGSKSRAASKTPGSK
jgi:hypothetical protein